MNTKNILFTVLLAGGLVLNVSVGAAKESPDTKKATESSGGLLKGVEILSGYGLAKLNKDQGSYRIIPTFVDFDFDLKPWLSRHSVNYPGLFQFALEPFISYVLDPHDNVEFGNNFVLKVGLLPDSWKFQLYAKAGIGVIYSSQHFREQATELNFNEFGGMGMHYFFKKNVALTMEYRMRHISNAGIKQPNHGINSHISSCGISYLF